MEKIQIRTLEISGLGSVLEALRLPYGKEARSEFIFRGSMNKDYQKPMFQTESNVYIDERDMKLLSALVKRGDEHAKVLRGLIVYAEINAPLSFWNEVDTYRIGTDRLSSTSTMHTIGKGGVSIDDFHVPDIIKEILSEPIKKEPHVTPLFIEKPKELKKVYKTYFDREYEIWNNGDIYSMPFDTKETLPDGSTRCRHFDKMKINIGHTRNQQGYYQVRLGGRNGKTFTLHRVLAQCFVDNPNNYNVVNHKNGNKWDCSISNLEWCTSSYNNKHAYENGLKYVSIRQKYLHYKNSLKWSDDYVRKWVEMREEGYTLKQIANIFNTKESLVCQYTNGCKYKNLSENSLNFEIAKYYEDSIAKINELASLYEESGDFEYVIRIKEILPSSFMQKRIQMFSYQTLRRIYFQRRNHRLPMWHDFCSWIESLPYAKEFITLEHGETR